jgi:hypothetical protein
LIENGGKEMMFLIGQKGKIPQLFVFKKPIVVKRLKNFGRMNGEIHVYIHTSTHIYKMTLDSW